MPRQQDPAHRAVLDDLRRRLDAGEWTSGDRLPSRARLAAEYQVGPSILQQAQEQLIREGLLEGRAGSGTYVRRPPQRRPLRLDAADLHGLHTGAAPGAWETIDHRDAPLPPAVAERLHLPADVLFPHTLRLFITEGRPTLQVRTWTTVPRPAHLGSPGTRLRPARLTAGSAALLGLPVNDLAIVVEDVNPVGATLVGVREATVPAVHWDLLSGADPTDPTD
ncbi:GntR family transcriptional regulator [Kitasatospora sp. NPDC088346]|uniref:GntR family transcriptional regulator n=1 Tax=Kitasatospora sp. NPDC088346 TaxID=3364073 RepID=UPI003810F7E7